MVISETRSQKPEKEKNLELKKYTRRMRLVLGLIYENGKENRIKNRIIISISNESTRLMCPRLLDFDLSLWVYNTKKMPAVFFDYRSQSHVLIPLCCRFKKKTYPIPITHYSYWKTDAPQPIAALGHSPGRPTLGSGLVWCFKY